MDSKNIQPMTQEIFDKMVESHELWLKHDPKGHRADFTQANLIGIDMRNRYLSNAIFDGAILTGIDMSNSQFYNSSFINTIMDYCACQNSDFGSCRFILTSMNNSDFRNSNLRNSKMFQVYVEHADFSEADLSFVNFYGFSIRRCLFTKSLFYEATFSTIRFIDTNLYDAYFHKATFNKIVVKGTDFNEASMVSHPMACPSEGEFIGWKKCCGKVIVKLKIPADAKRSSAFGMKCRTNKAEVLEIQNLEGETLDISFAISDYDPHFTYSVGAVVEEPNYCEDRWKECAPGIHFFVDRKAAVDYEL